MASTKKNAIQKIAESTNALVKFSTERAEIAQGLELAKGNETLERILGNSYKVYSAEVEYLRKNIIYNCGKVAEEMTDRKFNQFASVVKEFLMPTPAPETLPQTQN